MLKNNKWKGILSSALILLPVLIGLMLWDRLPVTMNIHWGVDGSPDGTGSRWMAVFLLPLILLVLHWLCLLVTAKDPKNKDRNTKAMGIVFWIIPACSLLTNGCVYATALGYRFSGSHWMVVLIALMFLVLGNYMPKVQQNSTFGIKIKWTMRNEENWNKTHRFGGKVWFACGFVILLLLFLPLEAMIWGMIICLLPACIAPMVYSYLLYRKQKKNGEAFAPSAPLMPGMKRYRKISLAVVIVILALITIVMFTGEIQVHLEENSFHIQASYHEDLTVSYSEIDSVTYVDHCDAGVRTLGFHSARLSMGTFENTEFGQYTRYVYTGCESCIMLRSGEKVLVINGKDGEETRDLYERLIQKMEQ